MHEAASFAKCLATAACDNVGLLFSFDGAARGNPGPASTGVCAWWGFFHNGEFLSEGLVLQKGVSLGSSTNNYAEATAMTAAVKTAVRYYFWMIGQLAQQAHSPSFQESSIH